METRPPSALAGPRVDVSGGTWVRSSALSSGPGTIIPEPKFPSRQGEEKAEARPRPPLGKGRGRALREAFWERVVFWERGTRHSLASRLRSLKSHLRTRKEEETGTGEERPGAGEGRPRYLRGAGDWRRTRCREALRSSGREKSGKPGHRNMSVASLAPGSDFVSFSPEYTLFSFCTSPGQCFLNHSGNGLEIISD